MRPSAADDRTVRLWLIPTDLPAGVVAALGGVLDDAERTRAAALVRSGHRDRFAAAHGAARLILSGYLDSPPERIRWRRGRHGKPELGGAWTGVHTNLSHSVDLAMLAIAGGRRVGVDVQRLSPAIDAVRLSARFYRPAEARFVAAAESRAGQVRRFVRLWTRKEACVKAAGGRLVEGLPLRIASPAGLVVLGARPYRVRDVPVPPGFLAAVALEGASAYELAVRQWDARVPAVSEVLADLVELLVEVTGEDAAWAASITAGTRLEEDLKLESIELLSLGDLMRARYGHRVDLPAFLAGLDIDQIIGLTVGDLAAHVASRR